MTPKPLIIVGLSGSGKTRIAREITARAGFQKVITTTTRLPRPGEANGREYHFLSREQFIAEREAGAFIEWAEFSGNLYGTRIVDLEKAGTLGRPVIVLEEVGAKNMKAKYPEATVVVLETQEAIRKARMEKDETDSGKIEMRLARDRTRLPLLEKIADVVVNNDGTLEETLAQIVSL